MNQIYPIRSLLTFLYKMISVLSSQLHFVLNNFLFVSGFATKSTHTHTHTHTYIYIYIYIYIYLFIYIYIYLFIYFHSHIYYIPHPPHPPLPDYPNNVWRGAEIMKLPSVKYSPYFCYFPLGTNISSSNWFSNTPSLPSQYPQ